MKMSQIIFTTHVDDMVDDTHVDIEDDVDFEGDTHVDIEDGDIVDNTPVHDIDDLHVDIEDDDVEDTHVEYIVHLTPVHLIDHFTHQHDKDDIIHIDNFFVPLLVLSQEIIHFLDIAVLTNVLCFLPSIPI